MGEGLKIKGKIKMTVQIISMLIALLAVIIGPIITYRITKKNLEFQFRSMIKETWVSKLEESSHSFLSFTMEWIEKYRGIADGSAKCKEPNKEIDRMFDGINSSIIKLQLLLEDEKPDHKFILDNVISMKGIVNRKDFDDNSINELRKSFDNIIKGLKKIFHKERTKIANLYR